MDNEAPPFGMVAIWSGRMIGTSRNDVEVDRLSLGFRLVDSVGSSLPIRVDSVVEILGVGNAAEDELYGGSSPDGAFGVRSPTVPGLSKARTPSTWSAAGAPPTTSEPSPHRSLRRPRRLPKAGPGDHRRPASRSLGLRSAASATAVAASTGVNPVPV